MLHHRLVSNAQLLTLQSTTQCAPQSNQSSLWLKRPMATVALALSKSFQNLARLCNLADLAKSGLNSKKPPKTIVDAHARLSASKNQRRFVKITVTPLFCRESTKTAVRFTHAKEQNVQKLIPTRLKLKADHWNAHFTTVVQRSPSQPPFQLPLQQLCSLPPPLNVVSALTKK